ncbi:hypothetical protein GDO81_004878, partial [Engystomops pustulosus]
RNISNHIKFCVTFACQEHLRQLEVIRQQYHNEMREIKNKANAHQEAPKATDGTYLVKPGNKCGQPPVDRPDGEEVTEEIQQQFSNIIKQNRQERKALEEK